MALAILTELSREGRSTVTPGRRTTLDVEDPSPLGDPELDDALMMVQAAVFGRKVSRLLDFLPERADLLRRMVRDGELREESGRRFGLLPTTTYTPASPATREGLVSLLRGVLTGQVEPDARTAHLVHLVRLTMRIADSSPRNRSRRPAGGPTRSVRTR